MILRLDSPTTSHGRLRDAEGVEAPSAELPDRACGEDAQRSGEPRRGPLVRAVHEREQGGLVAVPAHRHRHRVAWRLGLRVDHSDALLGRGSSPDQVPSRRRRRRASGALARGGGPDETDVGPGRGGRRPDLVGLYLRDAARMGLASSEPRQPATPPVPRHGSDHRVGLAAVRHLAQHPLRPPRRACRAPSRRRAAPRPARPRAARRATTLRGSWRRRRSTGTARRQIGSSSTTWPTTRRSSRAAARIRAHAPTRPRRRTRARTSRNESAYSESEDDRRREAKLLLGSTTGPALCPEEQASCGCPCGRVEAAGDLADE